MIWFKEFTPEILNSRPKNHIGALLDIQFTEIGENFIVGTMPVDERTHQPAGILHGGASVALAETLGSVGSNMLAGEGLVAVGLEINANHIRPAYDGWVYATARPEALGRTTHVWSIRIEDEAGKLEAALKRLAEIG